MSKNITDEEEKYQSITDVEIHGSQFIIKFANKDEVKVPISSLLPTDSNYYSTADFDYKPEKITGINLPLFDVSWQKIRSLTDPEYHKRIVQKAAESAKTIGAELKELREAKGFSVKIVADAIGMSTQTIGKIEKGETEVSFTNLVKILTAIGHKLADLKSPLE